MDNIFNLIGQIVMVFVVLWLIDRILLGLFGVKWRTPSNYEREKEER